MPRKKLMHGRVLQIKTIEEGTSVLISVVVEIDELRGTRRVYPTQEELDILRAAMKDGARLIFPGGDVTGVYREYDNE